MQCIYACRCNKEAQVLHKLGMVAMLGKHTVSVMVYVISAMNITAHIEDTAGKAGA